MNLINHYTIYLLSIVLLGSCTGVDLSSSRRDICIPNNYRPNYVSIDEAESNLESFLSDFTHNINSPQRKIASRFTLNQEVTKSSDDSVVMHVFNFDNNQGYAILAGDKRVPPILCFVETGNYSTDSANTSLDDFIMSELTGMYRTARLLPDSLKYDISPFPHNLLIETKSGGYVPVDTVYSDDRIYVYYSWAQNGNAIGTILPTKWGQTAPFYISNHRLK